MELVERPTQDLRDVTRHTNVDRLLVRKEQETERIHSHVPKQRDFVRASIRSKDTISIEIRRPDRSISHFVS